MSEIIKSEKEKERGNRMFECLNEKQRERIRLKKRENITKSVRMRERD